MAYVEIDATNAEELERAALIRIGWVNCIIVSLTSITRCFRCHAICGEAGHKTIACKHNPKCCLFAECDDANATDHLPGTNFYTVYKESSN